MLDKIINWSEVWGLLIPLAVIIIYKPKGEHSRILVWYVILALVLNLIATLMVEFYFSLPPSLQNNNLFYNLHSTTRTVFFSLYILSARKYKFKGILQLLLGGYLVFITVNFIVNESPLFINTFHFVAESILLLTLCISFFFRSMLDDSNVNWLKHPAFLVCTGLSLYEAATFFIYLFFYPLVLKDWEFGNLTLSIHNVMYVILCVMLAMALYKSRSAHRKKERTGL